MGIKVWRHRHSENRNLPRLHRSNRRRREALVLTLARGLDADVIITDVGETIKIPPLKRISASFKFALCNFSKRYDFFIFSGNWAHFAARRHKQNFSHRKSTNYFCKRWESQGKNRMLRKPQYKNMIINKCGSTLRRVTTARLFRGIKLYVCLNGVKHD